MSNRSVSWIRHGNIGTSSERIGQGGGGFRVWAGGDGHVEEFKRALWSGTDHLGNNPGSGHVLVFANVCHNRLKLLLYDGSGLWACAKKLDGGRLRWPERQQGQENLIKFRGTHATFKWH